MPFGLFWMGPGLSCTVRKSWSTVSFAEFCTISCVEALK